MEEEEEELSSLSPFSSSLCRTSPNSSRSPGSVSGPFRSPELQQRTRRGSDPVQSCDFPDRPAVKPTQVPTRKPRSPSSVSRFAGGGSRTPDQVGSNPNPGPRLL